MIRRAAAAVLLAALPLAGAAHETIGIDGGRLSFFAPALALAVRDGITLRLADGTVATAAAGYVDARGGRAVLAGTATVRHGDRELRADAIAFDLSGERVDLLDLDRGAARTSHALERPVATPIDGAAFAFPDLADRDAYIRSRHADLIPNASVRFRPAAFPGSVGALPVPMYLYSFAPAAGFAATSLPPATFDQPYGLLSTPTALSALHFRWLGAPGLALALQQHVVHGNDGYVAASIDAPFRSGGTSSLAAYHTLGPGTVTLDGLAVGGFAFAHVGLARPLGALAGRLDYARTSSAYSSLDALLRTRDRPLALGVTGRLTADLGFDAQAGGLYGNLPDRAAYATVWRRRVDAFAATPVVRAPLRTGFTLTADAARTWSSFPHHFDTLEATASLARSFSRTFAAFAGYDARWTADVYPTSQALFYPPTAATLPDGTLWPGFRAFSGATTARLANLDLQYTPNQQTALRVSLRASRDFPQFQGFGRPAYEARIDLRFRPFRNIAASAGKADDFGWGGVQWQPAWSFAVGP